MRVATWMIAAGLLIGSQALNAGQVYFEHFEAGTGGLTGAGAREGTQGFSGVPAPAPGFQSWFFRNTTTTPTTLTLGLLPSHSFLNIGFLLAIIDQWDGEINGDRFNVTVDGNPVFSPTYTNYDLGQPYGGTRLTTSGCACGFDGTTSDNGYAVSLSVPHTSSTATIEFFGSGALYTVDNNSWAIDNLAVSAEVPEPGTMLLAGIGAAALLLRRRHR